MAWKVKVWTVLVRVKLQTDQHPKTRVIHKLGGYGTSSDIGRGLYALADIWHGGHAEPTSGRPPVVFSVLIPSDLLRFHRRWRWIGGLELAEPLFFLLGLLFKVSLPLFELIVWFWQFVILLQV